MKTPSKGSLTEITFVEILQDAARSTLTGMVRLENGTIIKVVYFQNGAVAFASSNEKSDRLTEVLKRAGKLTPEQVEDAQARLKPNVSLGKTLVELGYISARDLLWGARAQVEGILHKLIFWTQGSYQILEGPLPKEIIGLNLPVPQIIYDGILTTQNRQWVLEHIGSPESVYLLAPDFHEKNAACKLQADVVVSRIDGKRSLEEISSIAGLETFETCKMVVALQLLELVKRVPEAPVQLPLKEQEAEEKIEPDENVSLGQVLQIPTVAELQQNLQPPPPSATPAPQKETWVPPPARTGPTMIPPSGEVVSLAQTGEPEVAERPRTEPTFSSVRSRRRVSRDPSRPSGRAKSRRYWERLVAFIGVIFALVAAGSVYWYFTRTPEGIEEASKVSSKQRAAEELMVPEHEDRQSLTESESESALTEETDQAAEEDLKPAESPLMLARVGKLPEAAVQWRRNLLSQTGKFSIQLEIACQEKTVLDALISLDYSKDMIVVPMDFRGKACYRVLFGVFNTAGAAESAKTGLPQEFLRQPSPPQVVPIARVLR